MSFLEGDASHGSDGFLVLPNLAPIPKWGIVKFLHRRRTITPLTLKGFKMKTLFITFLGIGFCSLAVATSDSGNVITHFSGTSISAEQAVALQILASHEILASTEILSATCKPKCKPGRLSKPK